MNKPIVKIEYRATADPGFLGRNGYGKAAALEIMSGTSEIFLTPFTSKGMAARCEIRIPKDPQTLRAVAQELQRMADEIEKEPTPC